MHSDLFTSLPPSKKRAFDLIVANPPFVPNPQLELLEEHGSDGISTSTQTVSRSFPAAADALYADGGERGVSVVQRIVIEAADWLRADGELRMVTSFTVPPSEELISSTSQPVITASASVAAKAIGLGHSSGWGGEIGWRTVFDIEEYSRYYEGGAGVLAEHYAAGLRRVGVAAVVVDAMVRLVRQQKPGPDASGNTGRDANVLIAGRVQVRHPRNKRPRWSGCE